MYISWILKCPQVREHSRLHTVGCKLRAKRRAEGRQNPGKWNEHPPYYHVNFNSVSMQRFSTSERVNDKYPVRDWPIFTPRREGCNHKEASQLTLVSCDRFPLHSLQKIERLWQTESPAFWLAHRVFVFGMPTPEIVCSLNPLRMDQIFLLLCCPSGLLCLGIGSYNVGHWWVKLNRTGGSKLLCHLPELVTFGGNWCGEDPTEYDLTPLKNSLADWLQDLIMNVKRISFRPLTISAHIYLPGSKFHQKGHINTHLSHIPVGWIVPELLHSPWQHGWENQNLVQAKYQIVECIIQRERSLHQNTRSEHAWGLVGLLQVLHQSRPHHSLTQRGIYTWSQIVDSLMQRNDIFPSVSDFPCALSKPEWPKAKKWILGVEWFNICLATLWAHFTGMIITFVWISTFR